MPSTTPAAERPASTTRALFGEPPGALEAWAKEGRVGQSTPEDSTSISSNSSN